MLWEAVRKLEGGVTGSWFLSFFQVMGGMAVTTQNLVGLCPEETLCWQQRDTVI